MAKGGPGGDGCAGTEMAAIDTAVDASMAERSSELGLARSILLAESLSVRGITAYEHAGESRRPVMADTRAERVSPRTCGARARRLPQARGTADAALAVSNVRQRVPALASDLDVMALDAEQLYRRGRVRACLTITSALVKRDPFHDRGVLVHVGALLHLRRRTDLFGLAHRLSDASPTRALSWYAIGAYYLLVEDAANARANFRSVGAQSAHAVVCVCVGGQCVGARNADDASVRLLVGQRAGDTLTVSLGTAERH